MTTECDHDSQFIDDFGGHWRCLRCGEHTCGSIRKCSMAGQVEFVQSAVVDAVNTLGQELLGNTFIPLTESPISDGEVKRLVADVFAEDGGVTQ
jgi:hypothetical protein